MNKIYEIFISTFLEIYKTNFPYKKAIVKPKDLKNPWMSKALKNILYSEAKVLCEILKQKTTEFEKNLQRLQKSI